jgi:hypothetical protein
MRNLVLIPKVLHSTRLTLLTNVVLGWKGLPEKDTLAYYEHL